MAFHPLLAAVVPAGGYISIWKVLPVVVLLLLWARLLTWADKDAEAAYLPRETLNCANFGGMIVAFGLFLFIPNFWAAFGALLLLFSTEAGIYLSLRNKKCGLADLKDDFKNMMKGRKKDIEIDIPPDRVQFMQGSTLVPAPAADAPERPAFETAQEALTEPLQKGAEQVDLAPEENGLAVKYTVDSVSYRGALLDRVQGAAAISFLKQVAGLDVEDRRKPQSGTMRAAIDSKKHDLRVQTAGTRAGEYLRIVVNPKKRHDTPLDKLGLSEAQLAKVKESIAENQGIVLVAAPKGHGLTTMLYAIIRSHDAFVQHLQSIERDAEQDLEGVTQNKLAPAATADEELKLVSWVMSQEPDAVLVSKVDDRQTALDLIGFGKEGKRVYIGVRAGSTFEALEQWVKLVGNAADATEALRLIICGRLMRKLCVGCKVAYNPDPATLKKLNINPELVSTLYQARTQASRDEGGVTVPCEFCKDLFYKGAPGFSSCWSSMTTCARW